MYAETFGLEVSVYERRGAIHEQDGERHSFGVCSPPAYAGCYGTYGKAVDEHTHAGHRRCAVVGGHEYGTEQKATAENIHFRRIARQEIHYDMSALITLVTSR